MAITIDKAFINEYSDMVRQIAQQGDTKLRDKVYEVSSSGESYMFERLGPTEAVEKTGRRQTTTPIDDIWSRRVAQPKTFNHTMTLEHEDKVQMLVDPQSNYAESQGMAMRRAIDDLIIAAATGTALDGDGGSNALPAAQVVGDGTSNITFDLVTKVQRQFMRNEIMPDEAKCFVVSPTQVMQLMQLTQNTSADYVNREALQRLNSTGIALNWMGFDWIVSNRLNAPAANQLDCFAFTKRAIGLAVNQDTFTRITENPEKQYMIQVFSQWTAGAVRTEDEHIVKLHVADPA